MKISTLISAICISITLSFAVQAEGSAQHSVKGSKHLAIGSGQGVVSVATAASVAVAIPVVVVGSAAVSVGAAAAESIEAGSRAAASSHHHHDEVLIITEKTITVDPAPDKVIILEKR